MRTIPKPSSLLLALLLVLAPVSLLLSRPAFASARPVVTSLSTHHGTYWGWSPLTIHGRNFDHVDHVQFGSVKAHSVHVVSPTVITVLEPVHSYGTVHVYVVTAAGASPAATVNEFTFTRPTMTSPIQGGLTARQEQSISAKVRAGHRGVATAPRTARWTPAMGLTAVARVRTWLGLPYSWAGGNARGPTTGVCQHNGGDLDCHVAGFDCSGLALYGWAPYKTLVHYAATQYSRAGSFHPAVGQLVPGDLVFFSGKHEAVIGHVAIYEGAGMVVQAEQSGTVIMRSRLVDVIAFAGRYRGATRPLSVGRQGPVPTVSAVTSRLPATGGTLTVTGTQLATATSVTVGSVPVYSFLRRTATSLVLRVPAHAAGAVAVTVSNPWGSARRSVAFVAAPQIGALSPKAGPAAGGTPVTITGTDLTTVTSVTLGGATVPFVRTTAGRLTLVVPAHAPGTVAVTLTSPFGRSRASTFTYVTPAVSGPTGSSGPPAGGTSTSSTPQSSPSAPDPTTSAPTTSDPTTSDPTTSAPSTSAPSTNPPPTDPVPTGTSTDPAPPTDVTSAVSGQVSGVDSTTKSRSSRSATPLISSS